MARGQPSTTPAQGTVSTSSTSHVFLTMVSSSEQCILSLWGRGRGGVEWSRSRRLIGGACHGCTWGKTTIYGRSQSSQGGSFSWACRFFMRWPLWCGVLAFVREPALNRPRRTGDRTALQHPGSDICEQRRYLAADALRTRAWAARKLLFCAVARRSWHRPRGPIHSDGGRWQGARWWLSVGNHLTRSKATYFWCTLRFVRLSDVGRCFL